MARKLLRVTIGILFLIAGVIGAVTPLTPWTIPALLLGLWFVGAGKYLPDHYRKKAEDAEERVKNKVKRKKGNGKEKR